MNVLDSGKVFSGMHGRKSDLNQPDQAERGSLPAFITMHAETVLLAVRLQPRASKNEIGEPLGDELRIKVTAPPVDSAANEALLRLLAEVLDCPRSKIELVRGHTSRHKTIRIHGLKGQDVLKRLL